MGWIAGWVWGLVLAPREMRWISWHGSLLLWVLGGAGTVLAWIFRRLRRQLEVQGAGRRRADAAWDELLAYCGMDLQMDEGGGQALGKRICRMVVGRSDFERAVVLLRNDAGDLRVVASSGVDDLTLQALGQWASSLPEGMLHGGRISVGLEAALGTRVGSGSFAVRLERRRGRPRGGIPAATELGCREVWLVPAWTQAGAFVGALAVGVNPYGRERFSIEQALLPIEALATRLGSSIEARVLTERLSEVERLVGLGQMAGEVAHTLTHPLTSVLAYAELLTETATEAGVRRQGDFIAAEARRMREALEMLLNFWRPPVQELIEVTTLLEELEDACASKLESRGVRLVIQAGEAIPPMRGSRERLREALEHLMNNAAQAISAVQEGQLRGAVDSVITEHVIRLTANYNEGALHLIVSDTGPGFREPKQVFDPFHVNHRPGQGTGLGLSLCYGIVREHGGEISAFNLLPHGAAVVLELPVREPLPAIDRVVVREVA